MRSGVVAQKLGMTRVFTEAGEHVPVTVLQLAQCQVVAHRTKDKNGYVALQLGSGPRRTNNMSKADRGYFAKAKVEPKRKIAEFRVTEDALIPVGAEITADHFVAGQFVDVCGISIGKGFAGGMKRWNFGGLRASHGVSVSHRSIGSDRRPSGSRQDLQEQEDARPSWASSASPRSISRWCRPTSRAASSWSRARCPAPRAAGSRCATR